MPSTLSKRVEKAEFLISCSEKELSTYRTQINLTESVGSGMSGLLRREIALTREVPCAIIERLLAGLALSLNVGKNLEPHQLSGLAKKIYAKYYYLSFDELIHVFDKGSSGQYGKLFDRVDEEVIFGWLEKYDTDERLGLVQKLTSQEIEEQKQDKEAETKFLADILKPITEKLTAELDKEKEKEDNYKKFREQYFKSKPEIKTEETK